MPTNKIYNHKSLNVDIYSIPLESFFHSAFSIDCVVFGIRDEKLNVLLIQRGAAPYENFWALPGDLVLPDEDLDSGADRILKDLTSLEEVHFKQVKTFGEVNRHPLGRVITISYYAFVKVEDYAPIASFWAKKTKWHPVDQLPKLAFDHKSIIDACNDRLKEDIIQYPIWKDVLPSKFTLTELQEVFEGVLNTRFDKGNFRKKLSTYRFLKALNELQTGVSHRPAELFTFNEKEFEKARQKGHRFDF